MSRHEPGQMEDTTMIHTARKLIQKCEYCNEEATETRSFGLIPLCEKHMRIYDNTPELLVEE